MFGLFGVPLSTRRAAKKSELLGLFGAPLSKPRAEKKENEKNRKKKTEENLRNSDTIDADADARADYETVRARRAKISLQRAFIRTPAVVCHIDRVIFAGGTRSKPARTWICRSSDAAVAQTSGLRFWEKKSIHFITKGEQISEIEMTGRAQLEL